MIKLKASFVLEEALNLILNKSQSFACAAIQDVETQVRWDNNGDEVKSNAAKIFAQFKPKDKRDDMKLFGEWWPKDDERRIDALKQAIEIAKKRND